LLTLLVLFSLLHFVCPLILSAQFLIMAPKVKGQKMSLTSFIGTRVDPDALPTGPSGNPMEETRPNRGGRWDAQRNDAEQRPQRGSRYDDREQRGGADGGEEEQISRADEADKWRRPAAADSTARRGGFERERPSFDRERGTDDVPPSMRSEGADDWRSARAGSSSLPDRERPVRGGGDGDEWRSHQRASARDTERSSERFGGSSEHFSSDRSSRSSFGERSERQSERFGGSGGDRFSSERSDRFGGGERSERFSSDRFGGSERSSDAFGDDSRRGDRGGDENVRPRMGRSEEPVDSSVDTRPAHLRKLLKKGADIETETATTEAAAPAPVQGESSLARLEREVAEKTGQTVRRDFRESSAASSSTPSAPTGGDPLKQPELAPIKLSSTRKAGAAPLPELGSTRPSPLSASRVANGVPAVVSTSPAVVVSQPADLLMDESRYAAETLKPVAKTKKVNPIEAALSNPDLNVSDAELESNLAALDLSAVNTQDLSAVFVRCITAGSLSLKKLVASVQNDATRALFASVLSAFASRKGESDFSAFIAKSGIEVLPVLVPSGDRAEISALLQKYNLPSSMLPVVDLSAAFKPKLTATADPAELVQFIDSEAGLSTPVPALAKLVSAFVFAAVYASKPPDFSLLTHWSPLLKRTCNERASKMAYIFSAQGAWFKAGGVKPLLQEALIALMKDHVVELEDLSAWRDDLKDKTTPGKPKAILQVAGWIKTQEEEVKKRAPKPVAEEEEGEDDEDEEEEDDDDDVAYPSR